MLPFLADVVDVVVLVFCGFDDTTANRHIQWFKELVDEAAEGGAAPGATEPDMVSAVGDGGIGSNVGGTENAAAVAEPPPRKAFTIMRRKQAGADDLETASAAAAAKAAKPLPLTLEERQSAYEKRRAELFKDTSAEGTAEKGSAAAAQSTNPGNTGGANAAGGKHSMHANPETTGGANAAGGKHSMHANPETTGGANAAGGKHSMHASKMSQEDYGDYTRHPTPSAHHLGSYMQGGHAPYPGTCLPFLASLAFLC